MYSNQWYKTTYEPTLEVRYRAEEIKSTLHKYKVEFNEKGRMEDNVVLLEKLAKRLGRRLIWTKNSTDPVEKKNEKSSKPAPNAAKTTQKKLKVAVAPQAIATSA